MVRYLTLCAFFITSIFAATVTQPLVGVQENEATIAIDNIDVGMSGFIVKQIDENHSAIINSAVVTKFDKNTTTATLKLGEYTELSQDYLPKGKWQANKDDKAVLAVGYSRAMLIAPSENVYYRITRALPSLEWLHPDIFASMLSAHGHPTPLKEDFEQTCERMSVGLLYFYIKPNLFTLDCKSMKLLQITPAPLDVEKLKLPFYSRVEKINANWFGEGSSRLKAYDPYYYEFLIKNNSQNKELYNLVKEQNLTDMLDEFDMKDTK